MITWSKRHWTDLLIFLFYCLLTYIVTYIARPRAPGAMYAFHGDALAAIWSIWWYKYAFLNHLPFSFCPLVASPFGINIVALEWFTLYPEIALAILTNEVFAFDFMVLISFPLSAMIMYYLCYHITKNKAASLVAGVIYSFSNYHIWRTFAWVPLASVQWIPLYFLFLLKLHGQRTYRNAIIAALLYTFILLSSYINGYIVAIGTLYFLLFWLGYAYITERRLDLDRQTLKVGATAILLSLAIILPFTFSTLQTVLTTPKQLLPYGFARPFGDVVGLAPRLVDYLLPPIYNPLFGKYMTQWNAEEPVRGYFAHGLYIGYITLILAIYGLWKWLPRRKQSPGNRERHFALSFFIFLFAASLFTSAAPIINIPLPGLGQLPIWTPSYFLYPIAPWFREYARFSVLVMLSAAILAALGFQYALAGVVSQRRLYLNVIFITALILMEQSVHIPLTVITTSVPEVYYWLASQPGQFSIAEYPMNDIFVSPEYQFSQRIHHKPMVNGQGKSRTADMLMPSIEDITDVATPGVLSYLGVKYVLIHKAKYILTGPLPNLENRPEFTLVKDFPTTTVYELHAPPALVIVAPARSLDLVSEKAKPEIGWWSTGNKGELNLLNTLDHPLTINLRFTARTFEEPRRLAISYNDVLLQIEELSPTPKEITVKNLALQPSKIGQGPVPKPKVLNLSIPDNSDPPEWFGLRDFRVEPR
ncbi:MAG: YfhO family protein [Chloroflexi bacterium]|nr:YfhO family protein [Chloroflexota bacterium]